MHEDFHRLSHQRGSCELQRSFMQSYCSRSFYTGHTKIAAPIFAASQPFASHNYNVSLFIKQSYGNTRAPLLNQDHALGAGGP